MKKTVSALIVLVILFSLCLPFSAVDEKPTKAQAIAKFKNSIQIGSYNTPVIEEEEDVKDLADNGVQFVHLFRWCVVTDYDRAIRWCEKYGLYVFIDDISIYMNEEQLRTALRNDRANSPAVIGHHIHDEPLPVYFDKLAWVLKIYKEEQPDLIPYYNLLPNYADLPCTFEEYISGYCEKVNTDYVCTDVYPLNLDGTNPKYLTGLAEVQKNCLAQNKDIWMYILGLAHGPYRTPTYTDFAFQNYIALSFGVTKIINFCYATPGDWNLADDPSYHGSVKPDGEKTYIYDITQTVNKEILFAAEMLNNYKNVGTFANPPKNGRYTGYMYYYVDEFDMYEAQEIESFKSSRATIVGCFEPKDGTEDAKAYTIVNSGEILSNLSSDISFSFVVPNVVTMYAKGEKTVLTPDENGLYSMTLENGQGIAVEATEIEIPDTFTISDALESFKYVAGVGTLDYVSKYRYDFDGDDNLTIAESLSLFKIVAGVA